MKTPDVNEWMDEVKALPEAASIGMMLVHRGVVRGTARSGEAVSAMVLTADRDRLAALLEVAQAGEGVVAVRAWVNEGTLAVGDDIMLVLVAGDVREHAFAALQRLVSTIKAEVVSELEIS